MEDLMLNDIGINYATYEIIFVVDDKPLVFKSKKPFLYSEIWLKNNEINTIYSKDEIDEIFNNSLQNIRFKCNPFDLLGKYSEVL
jgi:hypothetical protein